MHVKSFMKTEVITIQQHALLREAVGLLANNLVGMLPVVDDTNILVGVLTLDDVLRHFMPPFVELIQQADFIHDYGALEMGPVHHEMLDKPIAALMQQRFYVRETDRFMAPMVIMYKHRIGDVPVVDDAYHVTGLVSHAQVGGMFLKDWLSRNE